MHEDFGRARTPTAGGRGARASGCRGRLPLAVALAAIVGFVSTLLMGGRAYADSQYTTVLYHSTLQGGSQWIVGAWNKYDAAAMICGKTMSEIQGFDLVVRGKLSTNGGKFQELAESLDKDWPGWNEDTLNGNLEETFGVDLWQAMQGLSIGAGGVGFNPSGLAIWQVKWWQDNCDTNIYAANVTQDLVSQATADMNTILNGGNVGGGGAFNGSTITLQCYDSGVTLTSSPTASRVLYGNETIQVNDVNYGGVVTSRNAPNIVVALGETNSQLISQKMLEGWNLYSQVNVLNGSAYIKLVLTDVAPTLIDTNQSWGVQKSWKWTGLTYGHCYTLTGSSLTNTYTLTYDSANGCFKTSQNVNMALTTYNSGTWDLCNYNGWNNYNADTASVGGGGGGGGDGGNDWPYSDPTPTPRPEPPDVPDPPDIHLPEPGDPVVDPQIPTEPTTNVPDPVNAPDYTLWLAAILAQLRAINDSLAQHCVHLQQEIWDNGTRITNSIIARANSLEHTLVDNTNAMMDYLYDLFHWLAERMNFDNSVYVEPYNDSSVLYWLKRIYSKLTKDAPDIRQPDTQEPFDFWAWLLQLVSDTIGGIIGDLVGDLAGLLEDFTDKFPFSIPWDIAALLALLDAQRATPVFVVTIPAVNGWWPQQNYTIDLTPYNGVASVARTMINIWWLLVLAMKTDWMLLIMGDSASLGERFVRKISGGAA